MSQNSTTTQNFQEIKAINMKYFEKDEKPIPFLEVWRRDDEEKWRIFEWNMVSLWERRMKKTMNSKKCSRENWKVLKTVLKAQNMRFLLLNQVANKSPGQVAKHLRDKIFEKFSKYFSQLEGPPANKLRRELWKFWYNLTIRASTRKQVAKQSCENFKNPEFWKIF